MFCFNTSWVGTNMCHITPVLFAGLMALTIDHWHVGLIPAGIIKNECVVSVNRMILKFI